MYSIGKIPVVVLPMEKVVEEGREYISRGWCLLEFCLALSFDNIANAEIHPPVSRLIDEMKAYRADTVEGFRAVFEHAHFTESGDNDVVLKLFKNTLGSRSRV